MGAYQYVAFRSAHPPSVKRAIPRGELSRRNYISPTANKFAASAQDLGIKLFNRGYPKDIITQALVKPLKPRSKLIGKVIHRMKVTGFPWAPGRDIINHDFKVLANLLLPIVIPYDPRNNFSMKILRQKLQKFWETEVAANPRWFSSWKNTRVLTAYTRGRSLGDIFRRTSSLNLKHLFKLRHLAENIPISSTTPSIDLDNIAEDLESYSILRIDNPATEATNLQELSVDRIEDDNDKSNNNLNPELLNVPTPSTFNNNDNISVTSASISAEDIIVISEERIRDVKRKREDNIKGVKETNSNKILKYLKK
eukprot:Trichotokara_eunicae@DN4696_c0_g1_i4.p1